ncbi:lytic transglycosylase domain-containing protein [Aestuariivita boseongensis]|uniref:lytic transglycosylase domain-containing protein n=1 Tax=Aestuariivita boseongensis TaxID=1470562 RepID=UPI0006812444|nr:lytic transglycosylase domain-containing protein [Aestuariivita boseongensis]
MSRILIRLGLIFLLSLPRVASAQGTDQLATAFDEMREGDWEGARDAVSNAVAQDIVEWHRLRAGLGDFASVSAFLDRRGDWPGLGWLIRQNEENFANQPADRLAGFFDTHPPQTALGVYEFADALAKLNRKGEADAAIVLAWRTLPMPQEVQDLYLERHHHLLKNHHSARLDQMIWQRDMASARRALPLVDDAWKALATARIALHDQADGVDALIEAVPEALADHPGLSYERFVWRDRKGRDASAIELLLERSTSAADLGQPEEWAPRRRNLARAEMRAGNAVRAYQIASTHYLVEGSSFADLEWLSGYLALTYLKDPALALKHFERFDGAVFTPISKGRAGYWIGRAHEALGQPEAAQTAYAAGAQHQTSFYGLLAAESGGVAFDQSLAGEAEVAPWREAAFTESSVFKASLLLLAAGELDLAERFLTHLAESLDATQAAQLGAAVIELKQPHLAVMIGKRVAQRAIVIPAAYYPLHPMIEDGLPMHPEMNLAIARRESEFDPSVVSGAGARGLMQVMPRTAEGVARELGVSDEHSTERLTRDPEYNAKLGAAYLVGLAEAFDGNVIMMAAGYNAGRSRPISWMEDRGDPRRGGMDIVDWIEHIPFNETRNYVMRVAESLPVYRARLGKDPHPVPFRQELIGSTLRWPAN